jgi:hypothetical protein
MFWESFFVVPSDSQEISLLLKAWGNGDQAALDRPPAHAFPPNEGAMLHRSTTLKRSIRTKLREVPRKKRSKRLNR